MAEKATTTETGKKDEKPAEDKVERARLIAESQQFFGVSPHVVAGALSDLGGGDGPVAPSRAQKAVDAFLKRPVQTKE